jgi:hypothetical protein
MRRIKNIVHKYDPAAEIKIVPTDRFYARTIIPRDLWSFRNTDRKVVIELSQHLIEGGTWEEIEDVLAHEIAHILAAARTYEEKLEHTTDWYDIARALGSIGKIKDFFEDTENPIRYKIRCANCGYTVLGTWPRRAKASHDQLGFELRPENSKTNEHIEKTGHHKWYILDEVTGRRWTETL